MFIEQPPQFIRLLYPKALWRMDKNERAVYLTFDDGPIPEITPWVLDLLGKYGFEKAEDWTNYLKDYAEKVRNPLVVTVQK